MDFFTLLVGVNCLAFIFIIYSLVKTFREPNERSLIQKWHLIVFKEVLLIHLYFIGLLSIFEYF